MKKIKAFLNLLLILTISLSGCTQKQVVVQNPQLESHNKSAQAETSSDQNPEVVRGVSRVSGVEYSDTMGRMGSSAPEMVGLKSRLRENPGDSEARERLAELCFSRGAYITALEHYKELAAQLPDDSDIQLALAKTWHELRNNTNSLRHVKRAIELDSRSVEAYRLLGNLYLDDSDYVKAERAFLAGLQIDPFDAELLSTVGQTLIELEQAQKAQGFLEGALALNPEMQEARKALAVVNVLLGDQQGGLEQLMQLYHPAEAYSKLGTIYLEEERWTQAQELFQRALELEPNLSAAAWNLSIAESYISPPSVVAIPAFGGTEMRLAQEQSEPGVGQENTLALNEDLRLPVVNSLHESIVELPGFGSSAPRVAGLRTPALPDVLMDEGARLWTDEVMSLPRDSRPGEEFLVFQPEIKAHKTDTSEVPTEGNLSVASLSKPLPTDQAQTAPLLDIDSQNYLILSEVYAVVTIPAFEGVTKTDEVPAEVASANQQSPLTVRSSFEPDTVDVGLQRAAARESIELVEVFVPLSRDIDPVSPAVVSLATVFEPVPAALNQEVQPLQPEPESVVADSMEPEQESLGFEQEVRQEEVTQQALHADEPDVNGPSESRVIESTAVARLPRASGRNMRLYRAAAAPIGLDARNSRIDFSFEAPKAKPGFSSTQEAVSLALAISYSAERNPEDEGAASVSVFSLDSDDFGDGGVLPEGLSSQLATVNVALAPVPGVSANRPVRDRESVVAEVQPRDEVEIAAMIAPADSVETSQSPGPAKTEGISLESPARMEESAAVIETVTAEASATAFSESLIGEESTTQERKFAGVAWAFLFAGLLSMFLAMGIHLSRRRTTRTSTSEA